MLSPVSGKNLGRLVNATFLHWAPRAVAIASAAASPLTVDVRLALDRADMAFFAGGGGTGNGTRAATPVEEPAPRAATPLEEPEPEPEPKPQPKPKPKARKVNSAMLERLAAKPKAAAWRDTTTWAPPCTVYLAVAIVGAAILWQLYATPRKRRPSAAPPPPPTKAEENIEPPLLTAWHS